MDRRTFLKALPGLALIPALGVKLPDPGEDAVYHEVGIFGEAKGTLISRTIFPYAHLNSGDSIQISYTVDGAGKFEFDPAFVVIRDEAGEVVEQRQVDCTIEGDSITLAPITVSEYKQVAFVDIDFRYS